MRSHHPGVQVRVQRTGSETSGREYAGEGPLTDNPPGCSRWSLLLARELNGQRGAERGAPGAREGRSEGCLALCDVFIPR